MSVRDKYHITLLCEILRHEWTSLQNRNRLTDIENLSLTFIRRLFSSSSLHAIRMVSSAYLRLLIFLPAVLIPACYSSILAFYTGVSSLSLLQQIFPTQESNGGLLHYRRILYQLSYEGNPMMCSTYKLNKQVDSIHPWCTPFPILNQFVVSCLVLLLLDLHTGFSGGR